MCVLFRLSNLCLKQVDRASLKWIWHTFKAWICVSQVSFILLSSFKCHLNLNFHYCLYRDNILISFQIHAIVAYAKLWAPVLAQAPYTFLFENISIYICITKNVQWCCTANIVAFFLLVLEKNNLKDLLY